MPKAKAPVSIDDRRDVLTVSPEKVFYIIVKAREFDAKDVVTDPSPGSNPSDDNGRAVLEDHSNDPVVQEITAFIDSLSEDEQADLVALAWLGREDSTDEDWDEVRAEAWRARNNITASYPLGMPQLGDYLEEGLSTLGISIEEFEINRL